MNIQTAFKDLSKNYESEFFSFYGASFFLKREALGILKKRVLKNNDSSFNYYSFDAKFDREDVFLAAIRTHPGFFGEKLIILKSAEELKPNLIKEIIEGKAPQVFVVFLSEKALKRLSQKVGVLECRDPYENEMPYWASYIFQKENKKVDPKTIQFLTSLYGRDIDSLYQEIQKICSYVGEEGTIGLETVHLVSTRGKELPVFQLLQGLGMNSLKTNLFFLESLKKSGEVPPLIFSLLARQCRKLLHYKVLEEEGLTPYQIYPKVGLSPYFGKELSRQASYFQKERLEKTLIKLSDLDLALKTGQISPWGVLYKSLSHF
ncbi:MAG: DNA polymerase III subunit delta [Deltaproteobacteria bacterium]|nr:DNA polymerase III subunit delta [Deltaproteobacteria bacterium]